MDRDWLARTYLSPGRLLVMIAASVFVAEALVMAILHLAGPLPPFYNGIIDALTLLLFLTPAFYLFIFRPLTHHAIQHRDMSLDLERQRDLLKCYLDVSGVVILALDRDGRITHINRKGSEVLGYPEEEITGKDFFEDFVPEGSREEMRSACAGGGLSPSGYFESSLSSPGGERTILWHCTLLKGEGGRQRGALCSGADITERKFMEESLKERVDELERFRRATVARELRMKELRDRLKEIEDATSRKVRSF